jgi:hypothetical protein
MMRALIAESPKGKMLKNWEDIESEEEERAFVEMIADEAYTEKPSVVPQ